MYSDHSQTIEMLKEHIKQAFDAKYPSPLSLNYGSGHSNTTRSKSYKKSGLALDCSHLNHILHIDCEKRLAIVEPRVTMDDLVQATLPYGLMPAVVPEFKGITVGGAILGGAAESSSHRFGTFNDSCTAFEIICGNGTLLRATRNEHSDLFYGLASSYGSLGLLVKAEITLVPISKTVSIRYHFFKDPQKALQKLQELCKCSNSPDFLDGIIFGPECAVIIEGNLQQKPGLPQFSQEKWSSPWYWQHVKEIALTGQASYEESMSAKDYLFRYDRGAFWMGAYLFKSPLLMRLIKEGFLESAPPLGFTEKEINQFHCPQFPPSLWRVLTYPWMHSQSLWKLLHKVEKWVENRFIIQDFCIPNYSASHFLQKIMNDPSIFPIWLCPIKAAQTSQIFSPHQVKNHESHVMNFGVYGLPSYAGSTLNINRYLEKTTAEDGGRKVLYSHCYYPEKEFWTIYNQKAYDGLREKTFSYGMWRTITDKILS